MVSTGSDEQQAEKKTVAQHGMIRIMEVEDENLFPQLNEIVECSFRSEMERENFCYKYYTDFTNDFYEIRNFGGKIYAAWLGERMVGTASWKPGSIKLWMYEGEIIAFCHFAVLPEYQECGIGSALLAHVKQETKQYGLPLSFTTPEGNRDVVRWYVKHGCVKVKMIRVDDHYTVRFIEAEKLPNFDEKKCSIIYENTALLRLIRNEDIERIQADPDIQDKWELYFKPYMEAQPEEVLGNMKLYYFRRSIMPAEYYWYRFAEMKLIPRRNYLGVKAVEAIQLKYKSENPVLKSEDTSHEKSGIVFTQEVCVLTCRRGLQTDMLGAVLIKSEPDRSAEPLFLHISVQTGVVSRTSNRLAVQAGKTEVLRQISQAANEWIPNWEDLRKIVSAAALTTENTVSGWILNCESGKWVAKETAWETVLIQVQIANKRGIHDQLQAFLAEEIDVDLMM